MVASTQPAPAQTILVLDDERPILNLISAFLESQALACITTTDPREALEILERQPIDLVISDIHMDGMTGVEFLERARVIDPDTLVILMTGQPTVDTAVRSLRNNAYDYITKPFSMDRLFEVVERALEKQRLARENSALKDTLTLYQITQAVAASVDEREVIELVVQSVCKEVGSDRVSLFLAAGDRLARWGDAPAADVDRVERRVAGAVMELKAAVLVPQEDGPLDEAALDGLAYSAVAIPLRGRNGPMGVLVALRETRSRPFTHAHIQTMAILAGNASSVIDAARQSRLLIKSRSGLVEANAATIAALVNALDAREHETQVHSIRVAEYALRLAREVDYPSRDMEDLKFGALLHDVGKIGVRDSILLKAGPLTEDEWVEMRRHPSIGHEILKDIHFLEGASEIVLAHHERFDGGGYPRGLAGEEIPRGARIFSVVDTFDVMTSDRPYRKAMTFDDVGPELRRCSGAQFDPVMVEAFTSVPRDEWEGIARDAETSRFGWEGDRVFDALASGRAGE